MIIHSSTIAWKIPWTEEPGRLQSMGLWRVRHDWATSLSLLSYIGEGNGNPLQCSCLENPRDGRAWWAAVYGVAQSQTRLKRLSSSSSASSCYAPFSSFACISIETLLHMHRLVFHLLQENLSSNRAETLSLDDCDSPRICNTACLTRSQKIFVGCMNEGINESHCVTCLFL